MRKNIRLAALLILTILFAAALSGCITRNYTDDSGQQCQRKIKFFILFFKISSTCEPAESGDAPQASIQTNKQP